MKILHKLWRIFTIFVGCGALDAPLICLFDIVGEGREFTMLYPYKS